MRALGLTIHSISLADVIAFILSEEELEVCFRILDTADLIFVVDEVAVLISISQYQIWSENSKASEIPDSLLEVAIMERGEMSVP